MLFGLSGEVRPSHAPPSFYINGVPTPVLHLETDHARLKMNRVVVALMLVFLAAMASAQVNFTPSWGKRGGQEGCKASMDSILYLYKLIQSEAQKIVDCEKYSN
ncbi:hypothetical protein J437_LFUL006591 [Ladona fulva]|uniref:Adipokinetic hormone n=1 Tax=Ladona fulva TaxID=123851 RepID=A0A8K0KGE2_LADFU|nr:hypothetical protein J437_LFUL006591 [Ladona fulva]